MKWDIKFYAKLLITCCQLMICQSDEELIRESCSTMREILQKLPKDISKMIVAKYSAFLPIIFQKILTVRSRLTQQMILEIFYRLTDEAQDARLTAIKKQKFQRRTDKKVLDSFMDFCTKVNLENFEVVSIRLFLFSLFPLIV